MQLKNSTFFPVDILWFMRSRVSSGSIVSDEGLDDRGSIPGKDKGFFLYPLCLGPTQPPVQCVPRVLSPGVKRGQGVTLTTHPHIVPRSWMSRSYISSPPRASMACSGTAFYFVVHISPTRTMELNSHHQQCPMRVEDTCNGMLPSAPKGPSATLITSVPFSLRHDTSYLGCVGPEPCLPSKDVTLFATRTPGVGFRRGKRI
jgi:hypothetical protein